MPELPPLKRKRVVRGLTLWTVSRKTGISPSDISLVERKLVTRPRVERKLTEFYKRARRVTA